MSQAGKGDKNTRVKQSAFAAGLIWCKHNKFKDKCKKCKSKKEK